VLFSDDLPDAFDPDEVDALLESELDRDFPLGDGIADTETRVICPYCGEPTEISLDPGSGDNQDYIEDCEVCCRPWRVSVSYDLRGHATVTVSALD